MQTDTPPRKLRMWQQQQDLPSDYKSLDVDQKKDPEHATEVVNKLAAEYARHADLEHCSCPGCPSYQHGSFVVQELLQWKASLKDANLGIWNKNDIYEFMVKYAPSHVDMTPAVIMSMPHCIRDFIYFMADRGTISEEQSRMLAGVGDAIHEQFLAACAREKKKL